MMKVRRPATAKAMSPAMSVTTAPVPAAGLPAFGSAMSSLKRSAIVAPPTGAAADAGASGAPPVLIGFLIVMAKLYHETPTEIKSTNLSYSTTIWVEAVVPSTATLVSQWKCTGKPTGSE